MLFFFMEIWWKLHLSGIGCWLTLLGDACIPFPECLCLSPSTAPLQLFSNEHPGGSRWWLLVPCHPCWRPNSSRLLAVVGLSLHHCGHLGISQQVGAFRLSLFGSQLSEKEMHKMAKINLLVFIFPDSSTSQHFCHVVFSATGQRCRSCCINFVPKFNSQSVEGA